MKRLYFLAISILLISCHSTKVYMDYDENANLNNYRSYDYYIIKGNGLNDLDNKRVLRVLDSIMPKRGFKRNTIPDFNVNFYAEIYTIENQNNIGIGIGGGNRGVAGGVSSGIPINTSKNMISFTLEFIDGLNKELFWQTIVETQIRDDDTPKERAAFFEKIIIKALEKYPPEEK
jgi:hypothetical protein